MKRKILYFFLLLLLAVTGFGVIGQKRSPQEYNQDPYITLNGELDTTAFFENEAHKEDELLSLEGSKIYAQGAILMDGSSGRVLWAKNGDEKKPNASTTKILTCILALERGNFEKPVEVSGYAAGMPSVKLHMQKGEYYNLEDLLYSLMLESHNDSAVAIAEHVAGSVEAFSEMMNEKAKEIGAENSFFITPNGLDGEKERVNQVGNKEILFHGTTPKDLAKIMQYCILKSPKREEFLRITREQNYTFHNRVQTEEGDWKEGGRTFSCQNHNALLQLLPGALSGKTGYTAKAGYCYVGAIEQDGRTYIIALLGCGWPNHKNYKWEDSKRLFQYAVNHFTAVKPVLDIDLPQIPVLQGIDSEADFFAKQVINPQICMEDLEILLTKEDTLTYQVKLKRELEAPIQEGEKIGTLLLRVNDSQDETVWVKDYSLYADHTIPRKTWQDIWTYVCKRYVVM